LVIIENQDFLMQSVLCEDSPYAYSGVFSTIYIEGTHIAGVVDRIKHLRLTWQLWVLILKLTC